MTVPFPSFDDAFEHAAGYPRPLWGTLWARVEATDPEADRHEAAVRLERMWLDRLAAHLGGDYAVAESENFFLLAETGRQPREAFLAMAETTLGLVLDSLEDRPEDQAPGKIPVIQFTEDDDFYDYISYFYPDGNYGQFAGVCIREGEVHIALRCPDESTRRTFVHELTHACLAHHDLPLWLEEGVVEVVSRRVTDEHPLHLDSDARDRHYAFWSWHGLTGFWAGASFARPDELQGLSYELAEALVRLINAEDASKFDAFLRAAAHADGGESAARSVLGRSLIAYVAKLLGEGPWMPPLTAPAENDIDGEQGPSAPEGR